MQTMRRPRNCVARGTVTLLTVSLVTLCAGTVATAEVDPSLIDLSLEEILTLQVESLSKHSESYFDAPSSIYVIEHEDIVRSGATRLSELLQLVPGSTFADISYDQPDGTVRGFPGPYSGSILVLLDRVPVDSPITGAFFFSNFYIDIEEIERIEVIKGSGGAVYGANAATGVISIFTRSAGEEERRVKAETGTNGLLSSTLAGGTGDNEVHALRGWIKYFEHDGYSRNPHFDGQTVYAYSKDLDTEIPVENRFALPDNDVSSIALGATHRYTVAPNATIESRGFYSDSGGKRYSNFHAEYPETPGPALADTVFLSEERSTRWTLSSRYSGTFGAHEVFALASYHSEKMEQAILGEVDHSSSSAEFEVQDRMPWGRGHELDLGLTARRIGFRIAPQNPRSWSFSESGEQVETLYSGHLKNTFQVGRKLDLIASGKAEFWSLIGGGAQVSAALRSSYRASNHVSIWGAFGRNLANPSYREVKVEIWTQQVPPAWVFLAGGVPEDLIPAGAGHWLSFLPAQNPDPTEYLTSELGVRAVLSPRVSIETSSFFSSIRGQTSAFLPDLDVLVESAWVDGALVVPISSANNTDGWTAGGETILRLRWNPRNRLELSHSLMLTELSRPEGAVVNAAPPKNQIRVRGYFGLPARVDLTATAAWSSGETGLAPFDYVTQKMASEDQGGVVLDDRSTRWKLDLALQRTFAESFRVQAWGRNLLTDPFVESFPEFDLLLYPQTVERTFGVSLSLEP